MQPLPSSLTASVASRNLPPRGSEVRPHFRALYQQLAASNALRTLGVVGMARGTNATSVATELAMAAAVAGKRTLLIDAHFEARGVSSLFRCPPGPGLMELLAGAATGGEAIHSTSLDTLYVLAIGGQPAPGSSEAFYPLLEKLRPDYEWLVCDLTPVYPGSACLGMVAALEGVIGVIEAGQTREEEALKAKRLLIQAGAHILGVVLNQED